MTPEQSRQLHLLLQEARTLSLAVLVDGAPHVGLLPFARSADGCALLVHASRLARHSRGLGAGAAFSALVHAADDGTGDPLQVARVTLDGHVEPLQRGTPAYVEARAAYLERLPSSAVTFELGDFTLYALRVEGGRLVLGFAQALDVAPEDLAS